MKNHLFSKYSLYANIVFWAILVLITCIIYLKNINELNNTSDDKVTLTANNFEYSDYNEKGDLTNYMKGDKLYQYVSQDVRIKQMYLETYKADTFNKDWVITAPKAYITDTNKSDSEAHLYGGVHGIIYTYSNDKDKSNSSNKTDKAPSQINVESSEFYYGLKTKDFRTDKHVKIYDPDTTNNTTGIGMSGNSDRGIIDIHKNVRSYYVTTS